MKKVIVVCVMGLALSIGYACESVAMEFTKTRNSNCYPETNYHKKPCKRWSGLVELQHPIAWDYARRSHHEPRSRWYGVEKRVVKEKVIRMILEGVQFDFDKFNLRPDTIPVLERNVAKLKELQFNRINVVGYTDSKGTDEYNQVLSEKRAMAVKNYLVDQGIDPSRITFEGRGSSESIAPNKTPGGEDNPEGRAKNRRAIELQIITQ